MTLPPETPGPDPLLDEAIVWIVRLKTEEITRADIDDFQRWRARSAAHEAAFQRAALINWRAGVVAGKLTAPSARVAGIATSRGRLSRRALIGGGLAAAAVAGYAVIRPPFNLWPSLQELSADYRTAKGEQRTVNVTPEVSFDLNTLTSIALRSKQNQPTIELLSGEVVVSTRRPPQGDLIVLAAGGQIIASEARFSARCLDDVVSVVCLNGIVSVQQAGQSTRIVEGEQVSYTGSGLGARVSV
ncbi:MAG: FecR domain-containing protein, partial [Afipia sp.]